MNKMMIGVVVAIAVAVVGSVLLVQGYTSQPAFASTQSENQATPDLQGAEEKSATEPEPVEVVIAETNGNETIIESFTMGGMATANTQQVAQARPQVVASQVVAPRTVTAQQKAAAQAQTEAAQQQAAAQAKKAQEEAAKRAAEEKAKAEQAAAQAKAQQAAAQAKAQQAAAAANVADAPVAENAFEAFEATFVAPGSVSNISAAAEQSTRNVVEEEEVLSPSAPR